MQKTFQIALFFIFFINCISYCYEAKLSRRMFCYDGYGSDPENWKKVECFSGFCVKKIGPLNERRYCKTGSHATECIYDYTSYEIKIRVRYVWVSTDKKGMPKSKIICTNFLNSFF